MYVYYLHFYFYLIPRLSQGITGLQNSYPLSLHPVYVSDIGYLVQPIIPDHANILEYKMWMQALCNETDYHRT